MTSDSPKPPTVMSGASSYTLASMTTIDLRTVALALGKPEGEPVNAIVAFTPYAGGTPIVRVEGADVIIPRSIIVRLVDGAPTDPIDLPPTAGVFCYRVTVSADDGALEPRYIEVPDDDEPVAFGSLPLVDPDTYLPVSPTLPGAAELIADAAVVLELAETAADTANAASSESITSAQLVGYDLVLVARDGTPINVGDVRGPQGLKGDTGDYTLATSVSTASTIYNIAPSSQTLIRMTLERNMTFTLNGGGLAGYGYTKTVVLKQPAAGGPFTATWPAEVQWANGAPPPAMPTVPNAELIVHLLFIGNAWRGAVMGPFFP